MRSGGSVVKNYGSGSDDIKYAGTLNLTRRRRPPPPETDSASRISTALGYNIPPQTHPNPHKTVVVYTAAAVINQYQAMCQVIHKRFD